MEVYKIKRMWKKIRTKWDAFWADDEDDVFRKHLSQSDKRSLLYGHLLTSMLLIAFVILIVKVNDFRAERRSDAAMEELLNMVVSYMESAMEDEYDEIARTIRHDLVFSIYEKDMEKYIRYIPNTSKICRACKGSYPAQAVLVSLNTGESYPLDVYERGTEPEDCQGNMRLTCGYDEISRTSIRISKNPGENRVVTEIERGSGVVSVHKMKRLFCDGCIRAMLDTVEEQTMGELVICDTKKDVFYPVGDESKAQIGDYALEIKYRDRGYEIDITPVGETE